MRRRSLLAGAVVVCLLCSLRLQAQQSESSASDITNLSSSSQPAAGAVPRLIKFAVAVKDLTGKVPTGVVGLTFSLYELPEGGSPLWVETQSLALDSQGRYTALLGANSPGGLPLDLFTSGKALWVGVQPQLPGQPEQPRVLLVAAPYALKSSDADTLGGLPASAYMLSPTANAAEGSSVTLPGPIPPPGAPPPTSTTITGVGTANYAAMFTGPSTIGNSAIYNSFRGFVGIGTTAPAATLDVHGTGNFTGALSGSTGTFSGALSGTAATFTEALTAARLVLPDTAGGGSAGVVTIGGKPFLHDCCGAANGNVFVGGAGNLITTGSQNAATGLGALGGNSTGSQNAAAGDAALQSNNTGSYNTATGFEALALNTGGVSNTASGYQALAPNTTGSYNTAVGYQAGSDFNVPYPWLPTTGSNSTFVGAYATATVNNLNNAAAIGYNAQVSESNALVLGGTGANAVKVGIGTATPQYTLDVQGTGNFTGGVTFAQPVNFGTGVFTGSSTGEIISVTQGNGSGGAVSGTNSANGSYGQLGTSVSGNATGVYGNGGTYGVYGNGSTGVYGNGSTFGVYANGGGFGVFASGSSYGVYGNSSTTGVYGLDSANGSYGQLGASISGNATGVYGSSSTYGVYGNSGAAGVYGFNSANGSWGQLGLSVNGNPTGAYGTGSSYGVYGNSSSGGSGVYGTSSFVGVYGSGGGTGVYGSGSSYGVEGYNSANFSYAQLATTSGGATGVFASGANYGVYGESTGGSYGVFAEGNLGASGTKSAVVALPDDRVVSLYAVESPENWFEDFGSSQLKDGVATIELDPTFAQTVSLEAGYHVFLTPKGDCEGLYVGQETATGFEVRELRGGKSNVAFDYRIIAKRKGLESLRMEQVSGDHETAERIRQQIADRPSHTPKLVFPKAQAPPAAPKAPPEPPKFAAPPAPAPLVVFPKPPEPPKLPALPKPPQT